MKTIKSLFAVLFALLAFSACEKDGDKIYLQSLESNNLMATTDRVELNADLAQEIVVSLAWTDRTIQISDPAVGTTVTVTTYVEASLSEDFSTTVSKTATTSLSIAFTGLELNSLASEIGAVTGRNNKIYFRLAGTTGTNIPPVYSNVVSIDVTPYKMDMTPVLSSCQMIRRRIWVKQVLLFTHRMPTVYTADLSLYLKHGIISFLKKETARYGEHQEAKGHSILQTTRTTRSRICGFLEQLDVTMLSSIRKRQNGVRFISVRSLSAD